MSGPQRSSHFPELKCSNELPLPDRSQLLQRCFEEFDTQHKGQLHLRELMEALHLLNPRISKDKLQSLVHEMDADRDWNVDKEEFVRYFNEKHADSSIEELRRAIENTMKMFKRERALADLFDEFDADKNGKMSAEELKRLLMKALEDTFNEKQLTEWLQKLDKDHDNRVSKDEFVRNFYRQSLNDTDVAFERRMAVTRNGRRTELLKLLFDEIDLDGKGYLTINEFSGLMRPLYNTHTTDNATKSHK